MRSYTKFKIRKVFLKKISFIENGNILDGRARPVVSNRTENCRIRRVKDVKFHSLGNEGYHFGVHTAGFAQSRYTEDVFSVIGSRADESVTREQHKRRVCGATNGEW